MKININVPPPKQLLYDWVIPKIIPVLEFNMQKPEQMV